MSCNTQVSKLD